jgi:hypothetical protein
MFVPIYMHDAVCITCLHEVHQNDLSNVLTCRATQMLQFSAISEAHQTVYAKKLCRYVCVYVCI